MQPSYWSQILVSILTGSVVGVVAGFVTAHLAIRPALKEFASQRALERKERAYSSIIKALAGLHSCLGDWQDYLLTNRKMPEKLSEESEDLARQSKRALRMAAAVGELSVSEDTVKAVRELIREITTYYPDLTESVNRHYDAVTSCIPRVLAEAKKHLAGT